MARKKNLTTKRAQHKEKHFSDFTYWETRANNLCNNVELYPRTDDPTNSTDHPKDYPVIKSPRQIPNSPNRNR